MGTTVFAGWNSGGYGNLVVVQHRLGYTSWYAHLSTLTSWVGESVSGGTRIGYVGSTGNSTGPHLHFEVRLRNIPVDPLPYLLSGTAAGRRDAQVPPAGRLPDGAHRPVRPLSGAKGAASAALALEVVHPAGALHHQVLALSPVQMPTLPLSG